MSAPAPPLVVIADPIDAGAVAQLLKGPCRVIDATAGHEALEEHLAEAWALVVRSRTRVTAELIGRAPRLQVIARAGVGVDNVDLPAATARRIRVVNAPTAATASVAELTVAFCLLLVRDLYAQIEATRAGKWPRGQNRGELQGRTVGFIGYGRIAREVARRLAAFGVTTIAYDPFVRESRDATELADLDRVLARSDIVSLHAALTPENRHLMNAERMERMKRGAVLINVARGALVDEAALLRALDAGRIGGAALDVFEVEPPTRAELLSHPKVIPTPHLGASTHEAQRRAGQQVVDEVLRALRGEPLQSLVNPEARGPT
ncbi:MAG: hydroxyacid dehydrogenase [Thermoplasmata archaeon]